MQCPQCQFDNREGVRFCEELGRKGPVERWRAIRDEIHAEVLRRAWNKEKRKRRPRMETIRWQWRSNGKSWAPNICTSLISMALSLEHR